MFYYAMILFLYYCEAERNNYVKVIIPVLTWGAEQQLNADFSNFHHAQSQFTAVFIKIKIHS